LIMKNSHEFTDYNKIRESVAIFLWHGLQIRASGGQPQGLPLQTV